MTSSQRLCAALILLLPATVLAESPRTVRLTVAECAVALEVQSPEQTSDPPAIRIRPACSLSEESTRAAVEKLFGVVAAEAPAANRVSIFLGRLVDYPWLSRHLAQTAAGSATWDAKRGKARAGSDNAAVAVLLKESPVFAKLFTGWRVQNVPVEKVLIQKASELDLRLPGADHTEAQLPYDAMTWVRLERIE